MTTATAEAAATALPQDVQLRVEGLTKRYGSATALDAVTLWARGAQGLAVGYVAASVTLSLAALALGLSLGRPA